MGEENGKDAGRRWKRIYIGFFAALLGSITLWDVMSEDRYFSDTENRILAAKPDADYRSVLSGVWESEYETYLTDQFAERDRWIAIKTLSQKWMGKKDINGVYLAEDGYLIERHPEAETDPVRAEQKAAKLRSDVEQWRELTAERGGRVDVMLVPTANRILKDKLPPSASDYDQEAWLKTLDDIRIPVERKLAAHADEAIYYRTDHHWTTLGAYYGYQAWADSRGIKARPLSSYDRITVSGSFLGTLHSRLNLDMPPDPIEIFLPKEGMRCRVWYDLEETPADSLYAEEHLRTKNQYGVFLDENHALVRIENEGPEEGSILVLKDSYANCFIPFLCAHYKQVYVIDKRYYRGDIGEFIQDHGIADVLVLYNVIHFIEDYY